MEKNQELSDRVEELKRDIKTVSGAMEFTWLSCVELEARDRYIQLADILCVLAKSTKEIYEKATEIELLVLKGAA
jgi:hypothetical protein